MLFTTSMLLSEVDAGHHDLCLTQNVDCCGAPCSWKSAKSLTLALALPLKDNSAAASCTAPDDVCSIQVARYTAGVKRFDFDAGLAPYNLSGYAAWQRLSGHISPEALQHLKPRTQVRILLLHSLTLSLLSSTIVHNWMVPFGTHGVCIKWPGEIPYNFVCPILESMR